MSATPLPVDMWDKIVAQLPPPGPKLAPVIAFTKWNGRGNYCVNISKSVTEDELRMIVDKQAHVSDEDTHWCRHAMNCFESYSILTKALMLGWNFQTDADRSAFENEGRFFCLTKQ